MKKFSVLIATIILALTSVFAVPPPLPSGDLDNSGPWNPDAVENSMNNPIGYDND